MTGNEMKAQHADKLIFYICLGMSILFFIGGFFCPPMGVCLSKTTIQDTLSVSGKTTISNDLVVSGDVSTGGSGTGTGESACLGPVYLDMQSLAVNGTYSQSQMNGFGLTTTVINNMLAGLYTKVVATSGNDVYDYTGYKAGSNIHLYIRQGDGFDMETAISMNFNGSTWTLEYWEI